LNQNLQKTNIFKFKITNFFKIGKYLIFNIKNILFYIKAIDQLFNIFYLIMKLIGGHKNGKLLPHYNLVCYYFLERVIILHFNKFVLDYASCLLIKFLFDYILNDVSKFYDKIVYYD